MEKPEYYLATPTYSASEEFQGAQQAANENLFVALGSSRRVFPPICVYLCSSVVKALRFSGR